jgi:pimeloyl-ACP methyl ester carboxylesterase
LTSLADDLARLRQVLAWLDGPTIVAGHSYGEQIITALGADTVNVVGLVYVAGFGLDEGGYLGAANDEAIAPDAERMFAKRMGAETVEGGAPDAARYRPILTVSAPNGRPWKRNLETDCGPASDVTRERDGDGACIEREIEGRECSRHRAIAFVRRARNLGLGPRTYEAPKVAPSGGALRRKSRPDRSRLVSPALPLIGGRRIEHGA